MILKPNTEPSKYKTQGLVYGLFVYFQSSFWDIALKPDQDFGLPT